MKQPKLIGNKHALGYKHTPEEIEKIRQASIELWKNKKHRKKHSSFMKGKRFGLGYKHTKEEIGKIAEASKKLWQQKWYRDKMIEVAKRPKKGQFKKGFTPWNKNRKISTGRIGKEFYKGTRKRVKKDKCLWCESVKNLEYDHKLAAGRGGTNDDDNCQVLCKKCNLLKRNIIDYPELYHKFNAKRANSVKPLTDNAEGNAELNSQTLL